jgi:hypothetical protein
MRIPPSEAFSLTLAQVHDVAFYPREKDGQLKQPRAAPEPRQPAGRSLKRDLAILSSRRRFIDPGKYREAVEKLLDRWEVPEAERGEYRG